MRVISVRIRSPARHVNETKTDLINDAPRRRNLPEHKLYSNKNVFKCSHNFLKGKVSKYITLHNFKRVVFISVELELEFVSMNHYVRLNM